MSGLNPVFRAILAAAFIALVNLLSPGALAQDSVEEQAGQALSLFNSGDYGGAAAAYARLIERHPDSPIVAEARFRLAYINLLQARYDEALDFLQQLFKGPEPSREVLELADILWPQILAAKGGSLPEDSPERKKTLGLAIDSFNAYVQKYPEGDEVPNALYGRAVAEVQLGALAEAETTLREVLQSYPRSDASLDMRFMLGIVLAAEGGQRLESANGKAPPEASVMLEKAAAVLEEVASDRSDSALANDARFQLAEVLYNRAIYVSKNPNPVLLQEALKAYREVKPKAQMVDAQEARIANILAQMREAGSRNDIESIKRLQRFRENEQVKLAALKDKPDRKVEAAIKQAEIYYQLGKPDETRVLLSYLQPFARDIQHKKEILYYITLSYASQKVADKAVENYGKFRDQFPRDPMGDNLPIVVGAIFLDPKHRDPEKALHFFDEALSDYPDGRFASEALTQKAAALQQLKSYDAAAESFHEFLKSNPRKELAAAAEFGLATILKETGKQDEAIAAFNEVISRYPNSQQAEQAAFWIAKVNKDGGDLQAAITAFQSFVKENPDSSLVPAALLELGQLQTRKNETVQAIATYKKLIEEFPDNDAAPYAYFALAQIYGSGGQSGEMVEQLKKFVAKYPKHEQAFSAYDTIAQNYLAERKVEKAVATYREMVDTNPRDPQAALALQKIAEILHAYAAAQGRYIALDEKQRATWEKAVEGSIAAAEQLLNDYPDSPAVALALQTLLADQQFLVGAGKRMTEGIDIYFQSLADKFENKPATRSKILFTLASHLNATDKEKALELMENVYDPSQKYAPGDIDLYTKALLDQGKIDKAEAVANKLTADYTSKGDPKQAPREVQEAQAIGLHVLSQVAQAKGDSAKAGELSSQLKTLYPWSPKVAEANYLIAQSMMAESEFDAALAQLVPTIRSSTAPAELRAQAMLLGGKIQQAKAEAFKAQGNIVEYRRSLEAAIDYYLKIAAFYEGVPSAAAEGLWRGGQLLETQAGTR